MNTKNINYFNKIILESTPLSPQNIHTNEFKYLYIIRKVSTKRLRKLKDNRLIQHILVETYLILKPKSKREIPKDLILKYLREGNVNALLKVSKLILDSDFYYTTKDMNIFQRNTNFLTIYDQADPTVWLRDVRKELPIKKKNILQTRIGTHLPSLYNTKSILKRSGII